MNPFAVDVKYDDGERKFEGREGFTNHTYIKDNVDDARAAVTEMRMGDLDAATIVWRLQGRNSGGALDVEVTTTLRLNLITGRATEVTEVTETRTEADDDIYTVKTSATNDDREGESAYDNAYNAAEDEELLAMEAEKRARKDAAKAAKAAAAAAAKAANREQKRHKKKGK